MSSDLIKHINDSDFDVEVLQSTKAVLVDFWAPWCGPCKAIAPVLDDLAESHAEKLQIIKINVDDNRDSPARFGIRGIPALLLFKGGSHLETIVGSVGKEKIIQTLDKHL